MRRPGSAVTPAVSSRNRRRNGFAAEQPDELAPLHGRPSSGLGPHITTPLCKNVAVHHSKNCALMSQMGALMSQMGALMSQMGQSHQMRSTPTFGPGPQYSEACPASLGTSA
jgi:hypothetical protein